MKLLLQLLALASYLAYRHESDINLLIKLLARKQINLFLKMLLEEKHRRDVCDIANRFRQTNSISC